MSDGAYEAFQTTYSGATMQNKGIALKRKSMENGNHKGEPLRKKSSAVSAAAKKEIKSERERERRAAVRNLFLAVAVVLGLRAGGDDSALDQNVVLAAAITKLKEPVSLSPSLSKTLLPTFGQKSQALLKAAMSRPRKKDRVKAPRRCTSVRKVKQAVSPHKNQNSPTTKAPTPLPPQSSKGLECFATGTPFVLNEDEHQAPSFEKPIGQGFQFMETVDYVSPDSIILPSFPGKLYDVRAGVTQKPNLVTGNRRSSSLKHFVRDLRLDQSDFINEPASAFTASTDTTDANDSDATTCSIGPSPRFSFLIPFEQQMDLDLPFLS